MKKNILFVLIFLLGIVFVFSSNVYACSCIRPLPVLEQLSSSDTVIFSATVTGITKVNNNNEVNVNVDEVWKGELKNSEILITADNSAACGYNFIEGKKYLIFTNSDLNVNLCNRISVYGDAKADLDVLNSEARVENKNCIKDTDCPIGTCPDGSTYQAYTCQDNKCGPLMFVADPCLFHRDNQSENDSDKENETFELSNGRKAEIKIMPETASAKAIERLGELGFNITLKEVGKGNETRAVYHLEAEKDAKLLGLIKKHAKVEIDIDAENDGKIISTKRPWWSFMASGV